jgi:hypothetical protein
MAMSNRLGLVGWNTVSGLGTLNRQLADYASVDVWLVRPHPNYKMLEDHPNVDTLYCPNGLKLDEFLEKVDTVLFCETPYYLGLPETAKEQGKRVVCVPMQEWMPQDLGGWPSYVDLFICPTKHCYTEFCDKLPCVYFPWPVDTLRFTYKQRTTIQQYLFIPGNGGYLGRKGCSIIAQAQHLWPEMPLIIAKNMREQQDLYKEGDILLCPHSCDGLGLEPMESMSCGIPCILPWGNPWNEFPAIAKLESRLTKQRIKRLVDWHTLDAHNLVDVCKELLGEDIKWLSESVRGWAEARSWERMAEQFTNLVKHGVAVNV